jgi:hypothetical protein
MYCNSTAEDGVDVVGRGDQHRYSRVVYLLSKQGAVCRSHAREIFDRIKRFCDFAA